MTVEQIYALVNNIAQESLGSEELIQEDLSNVVDVGNTIANLTPTAFENFTRTLIDHIGRVVFVNRPYDGVGVNILRDSWEYGSILEKITAELPEAQENQSWNLQDNTVYEQDRFRRPSVSAKFFNSKLTWEIQRSMADRQVKSAFDNASQLNAFFSMLETSVYNAKTVRYDELCMRAVNNFIAGTVNADFAAGAGYDEGSRVRSVNLLYLYNQQYPDNQITSLDAAMVDARFIRFASYTMSRYMDRLKRMSRLFNVGEQARFTPKDRLHFMLLSDFARAADVFNQSDTFHDQFTALPEADRVPYWQGTGTDYGLEDITTIKVDISNGSTPAPSITLNGVLGVMFDHDALGVCNTDERVTTHYNAAAEFTNYWYKTDTSLFNDFNEQGVVFYAAVSN